MLGRYSRSNVSGGSGWIAISDSERANRYAPHRSRGPLDRARSLIATLHDQLTKIQRENATVRRQLDVVCQRLFGQEVGTCG